MSTANEINRKIIAKLMEIQHDCPELSILLNEMTITIPSDKKPEINIKILSEYYDSLYYILKNHLLKPISYEN